MLWQSGDQRRPSWSFAEGNRQTAGDVHYLRLHAFPANSEKSLVRRPTRSGGALLRPYAIPCQVIGHFSSQIGGNPIVNVRLFDTLPAPLVVDMAGRNGFGFAGQTVPSGGSDPSSRYCTT